MPGAPYIYTGKDTPKDVVENTTSILEIPVIEERVGDDARRYKLTREEVDELRAAYLFESDYGETAGLYRKINNSINQKLKETPLGGGKISRSSEEIIEGAKRRLEMEQPNVSPTVPVEGSPQSNSLQPPEPSVLQRIGDVLGGAGRGLVRVADMTFDALTGVGKVGVESALTLLARGDVPASVVPTLRRNVGQVVLGQVLAQVQAQMQRGQQGGIWECPSAPFERDAGEQVKIEAAMGNPANMDFVNKAVADIVDALRRNTTQDPVGILVQTVANGLNRQAETPQVWAENPQIPPRDKKADRPVQVIVFGQPAVVNGGCFGGVMAGRPVLPQGIGGGAGDGRVDVQGYTRSTGEVRAHVRNRPDGEVTNNLSYKEAARKVEATEG